MKKTKILTIALLLATLAGCGKDNDGRIRIFAEKMTPGGNAKVQIDPTDQTTIQNGAKWAVGEKIDLNGSPYTIASDVADVFYLSNGVIPVEPLDEAMYAIYPCAGTPGADVSVTNNGTAREVVINRLTVNLENGKQDIAFPMAAYAAANTGELKFRHITAGLYLTLANNSATAKNISYLRVVAQTTSDVNDNPLTPNVDGQTFTAKWAEQGPWVPSGQPGSNGATVDVKYSSVMNFNLTSGSANYYALGTGSTLKLCIPVTINFVRYLVVTGYDENGTELFNAKGDLGSDKLLEANKMYPVKTITIQN